MTTSLDDGTFSAPHPTATTYAARLLPSPKGPTTALNTEAFDAMGMAVISGTLA